VFFAAVEPGAEVFLESLAKRFLFPETNLFCSLNDFRGLY
jgi:hypothetical protein